MAGHQGHDRRPGIPIQHITLYHRGRTRLTAIAGGGRPDDVTAAHQSDQSPAASMKERASRSSRLSSTSANCRRISSANPGRRYRGLTRQLGKKGRGKNCNAESVGSASKQSAVEQGEAPGHAASSTDESCRGRLTSNLSHGVEISLPALRSINPASIRATTSVWTFL